MSVVWTRATPGGATHALLVGIGDYPYCGSNAPPRSPASKIKPLTSPPVSAHELASWLIDHRDDFASPLGSVTLLADAVPDSRFQPALPEFDAIKTAMRTWQDGAGDDDCLLLYWCSHGFEHDAGRLLLCRDAGKDGDDIWDRTADNGADFYIAHASKARTQLWLIDACRDDVQKLGSFNPHGRSMLPEPRTSTLAAAAAKDCAAVLATGVFAPAEARRGEVSYFCEAVTQAMTWGAYRNAGPGRWVVRTTSLVEPINQLLRAKKGVDQQCRPQGGTGRDTLLQRSAPPFVPTSFRCDPISIQPEVTLAVSTIDLQTLQSTLLRTQSETSEAPWVTEVPSGAVELSGQRGTQGERHKVTLMISPEVREGVLPWPQ